MLPLQDTGGVDVLTGSITRPAADLLLPGSLTASQSATGYINTGIGCNVYVTCETASGSVICKTAVAAASGGPFNFVATGATFNSTTIQTVITQTTLANPWFAIQLTDSGVSSGLLGGTFVVLCAYGYTAGENWHSAKVGYLGTASKLRGDGTGSFSSTWA